MARSRIFVSYSLPDDWRQCFVEQLQAAGCDVWSDDEGPGGSAAWQATTSNELREREILLMPVTPAAWASDWMQEELRQALAQRRQVVAVLREPTNIGGAPAGLQQIDVAGQDCAAAARQVIAALRLAPGTAYPPPGSLPPPRAFMGRFYLGLAAYIIAALVIQYTLILASVRFKLHLERPQTFLPHDTPIVGGMSLFSLIYVVLLIVLIWLLYRVGVMPRRNYSTRRLKPE